MIINQEVSSPVVSNVTATPSRFKIKASAKAFKILSGFYSEPILAIPRELGANAWDSHVKAKNTDKMFLVHAPNHLEPWFSVRDYGTGLSPEHVDTIYTTYFESTKTSDNDSDGCMGLGSKTPFNYTDNFNVTSFYKGKKYVYNCFIDEQGSPNIMQVAVEDSSEHNGLEIKFGVKSADIGMWVDKITRAYEPFRYRPTIVGANIAYQPREYIYQGKNWAMRKNDGGYYNRGCNAFMGNYCYPINAQSIRRALYNVPNSDGYKLEQALSYGNFDFFFNIGDLEVAPNKEQLQYEENNATTLGIITALQTAVAELKDLVHANIETPKTRWEAMYLYNKYNSYGSQYSHVRTIIGDIQIKLGKEIITSGNETINNAHSKTGVLALYANATMPAFQTFSLESSSGRFRRASSYHPHSDSKKVIFFYTNQPTIKSARLRYYLRNKYSTVTFPNVFVIIDASNKCETFLKHKAYFGWDDANVTEIESLPKPPPTPRQKKTVGTDEIWYSDITDFTDTTKKQTRYNGPYVGWCRKAETIDSNNTYYYVDFYYSDARWDNRTVTDQVATALKLLVKNKVIDSNVKTIYGINVKNQALLKVGKWVNIFDLAKKELEKDRVNIEQALYINDQRARFETLCNVQAKLTRSPSIITNIKKAETRHMFQAFMKIYSSVMNRSNEDATFITLFGFKAKKHQELEFDVESFHNMLNNKYMGILSIDASYYNESVAPIYKVINFVDEKS